MTTRRKNLQLAGFFFWAYALSSTFPVYLAGRCWIYLCITFTYYDSWLYTGYTPDLKSRKKSHDSGFVTATKHRRPLFLIHYEAFIFESDAKRRELYLKGGNGKKELETIPADYFKKNPRKK